jgi:hypothetical protein
MFCACSSCSYYRGYPLNFYSVAPSADYSDELWIKIKKLYPSIAAVLSDPYKGLTFERIEAPNPQGAPHKIAVHKLAKAICLVVKMNPTSLETLDDNLDFLLKFIPDIPPNYKIFRQIHGDCDDGSVFFRVGRSPPREGEDNLGWYHVIYRSLTTLFGAAARRTKTLCKKERAATLLSSDVCASLYNK